jgi:ribosomal protein L11 methylase PrmA
VAAAAANASANGVAVQVSVADLVAGPPPAADAIAANVPPAVHAAIAAALPDPVPSLALVSGFGPADEDAVLRGYAERGLAVRRRIDVHGWVVAKLET